MANEVYSWKLDTGEEVVGSLVSINIENGTFTVNRPRAIAIMPGRNGQMGMTLVPFMASNQDGDIELSTAHIVASTTPAKDLQKGYLESTTSLVLPK
jgi:hypothetical protein